MVALLQGTLRYMIPMMLVALAGVYAERSGIINIALEGIMIMGSFSCAFIVRLLQQSGAFDAIPQVSIILGLLIAAVLGAAFSLLLSFAAVKLKADQTITGTALNLIAPAVVLFIATAMMSQEKIVLAIDAPTWCIINVDIKGTGFFADFLRAFLQKTYLTTFIGAALFIVMSIVLYKTKFGLRLRSCGEHPQAADSAGINVYAMRYAGTAISGALGAMGGFIYSLTIDNGSATGTVAGFGFLAMAIMIFGNWKPGNIAIVSFLFAVLKTYAAKAGTIDINGDGIADLVKLAEKLPFLNSNLYNMVPYVITLIVLAFTSKSTRAPKAEGIPYDKGKR